MNPYEAQEARWAKERDRQDRRDWWLTLTLNVMIAFAAGYLLTTVVKTIYRAGVISCQLGEIGKDIDQISGEVKNWGGSLKR